MAAWWKTLGSPDMTPEFQRKLIDSVHAEVGSRTIAELEAERDELLIGLVELRSKRSETAAPREVAAGKAAVAKGDIGLVDQLMDLQERFE